ncbi:MAG: hypothetical protein RR543_00185 [Erysipelotrichales bacterium]
MKKRISLILLLVLVLNACMTMPFGTNNKVDIEKTKNGNVIFTSIKDIGNIQTKENIEMITSENNNTIANELGIKDPASISYEKNYKGFKLLEGYGNNNSAYALEYADFIDKESYSVLNTYDLKDNEKIDILKEISGKNFNEFKKKKTNDVVDNIIIKELDKIKDATALQHKDLNVKKAGKYELRAYPVIRTLHFKDKKQILDYDFSVIFGMDFELVKIK